MAITVGNTNTAASTSNTTAYSCDLNNNKDMVIAFAIGMATTDTDRTSTATYNSVNMPELITVTGTTTSRRYRVSIFGLAGAATGLNTCTVTYSTGIGSSVIGTMCLAGQAVSFAGDTDTNTAGCVTSIITTQANSIILSAACVRSNTTPPTLTPEADQTEVVNTTPLSGNTDVVGGGWYRIVTSTGTYSVGATASDTTGDFGCAVELKELVSGIFVPRIMIF